MLVACWRSCSSPSPSLESCSVSAHSLPLVTTSTSPAPGSCPSCEDVSTKASAPAVKRLSLATWASVAWRERCCCSSAAASSLSESASSSPHSWAWATTSLDDAAGVGDCCMVMAIAMASAPAVRRLSLATWASVAWRDSCCCCCGAAASSSESASSSSHSWASATTATSMEETAGVEECCTTIAMASAPAVKRRSLATWASRAWRDGSSSESASSSPHSSA
mmetsp:Transcript_50446/g.134903  ORF Transcript_50446/g.134903 Transcript_50446/m.134903 type:complete len:222 (+) Transcript_50446:340-1005(+)